MSQIVIKKNYEMLYEESLIEIKKLNEKVQLFELRKAVSIRI